MHFANVDMRNYLSTKAFNIASEHGFHDDAKPDTHWLMLNITELCEVVEADKHAKPEYFINWIDALKHGKCSKYDINVAFFTVIKDTVEDELADAYIRVLEFAGLNCIDLNDVTLDDHCIKRLQHQTFIEFAYELSMSLTNPEMCCFIDKHFVSLMLKHVLSMIEAWCVAHDIDLLWHVNLKMMFNAHRIMKHGKAY